MGARCGNATRARALRPRVGDTRVMSERTPDQPSERDGQRGGERPRSPSRSSPRSRTGPRSRPRNAHPPDPTRTGEEVERLEALAHELGNLLDGSMRCLSLAGRSLHAAREHAPELERAARQVETARTALGRMAELVHAAMQNAAVPVGSAMIVGAPPVTLGAALEHACDVLRPEAEELGVRLSLRVDDDVRDAPSGPAYAIALNALRNAVEATATLARPGKVEVSARWARSRRGRDAFEIEVLDTGHGPPAGRDALRVFERGFTTRGPGRGVGLKVCRALARAAGGVIELRRRPDGERGALFRVVLPVGRGADALRTEVG